MKSRVAFMLVILGGVLGSIFTSLPIPIYLIALVGGFFIGFSFMIFTSVYSGRVWGIKIPAMPSRKIKIMISIIGLLIGGFSIVQTSLVAFLSLLRFDLLKLILVPASFLIPLIVGPFVAKKYLEKDLAKGDSASILWNFDIFKEIDADLEQATSFVVGFEGVALFSNTNYCYAIYRYEDYQLGDLSTPEEVALVGTYFVQKYSRDFTFKVDVEVIPGKPGQTVVAVGTGGIGVARIKGTRDKRLFRSYIFTRK